MDKENYPLSKNINIPKPLKVDKSLSFIGQSKKLLANNPTLQKDRYLNKASYQEYKQSLANFFPKVQLSAQGGQSKVQNFSTSNKKVKLMLTDASAIASWNIFNGFKDYNKARSAKVGYHAMKDNYSYDKSDLTLQLVQSELDLELYERLLANDQSNVKVHQKIWDLVSKRSKKGYDRISARKHALSRLSLAKTHVLSDEQSLSDAKVLYEKLVGYKPSRILKLPEVKRSDLPVDAHMALLGASDNNLNLKSKYKSYLQSRYNSSESRSEFFPKIDLVASASVGRISVV